MHDETKIVRERQKLIRRELDRRGVSIKAVQLDGGWDSPSTVLSYFPLDENAQPAVMSAAALYRLIEKKAIPLDLLSLMLPDGFQIIRAPEGINHDVLGDLAAEYVSEKQRCHHPESEAGRDIGPGEAASLNASVVRLVGSVAA